MPFSDQTKLKVKRLAFFKCCICQRSPVEVHHIIPESEGGENTEDNAVPLCPLCHERYGMDATKRKFIREARDHWYEICKKRYSNSDIPEKMEQIATQLTRTVTKNDLKQAVDQITNLLVNIVGQPQKSKQELIREVSDVAATISDATASFRFCTYCGQESDRDICPHCGKDMDVNWT